MSKAWFRKQPELLEEIRQDLTAHFPDLHVHVTGNSVEIRGSFPIIDQNGVVLDRYSVSIMLPRTYPTTLPIVREIGGRIPWRKDLHIESNGNACVMLPDARWKEFPIGAPLLSFLKGPLHNFFLGQSLVAIGEPWPFKEWGHGADGVYEFYSDLLGCRDHEVIHGFLRVFAKSKFKGHWACPCGSGRQIRDCCKTKIIDYRSKIATTTARKTLKQLALSPKLV